MPVKPITCWSESTASRLRRSFLERLPALPIRLVLPDEEAVIEAARLKSTRRLSYADSFAAALARQEKAVLVTGDPELGEMAPF